MLPRTFPIFPLPNVVLFPNVFLPLHIFEPRYREMVTDALATDRVIGMVLLRDDWQDDYEGHPPVYAVGCAGLITHVETLPDGRYDIVLRGLSRFRIQSEDRSRAYRIAAAEPVPDPLDKEGRLLLREQRRRIETLLLTSSNHPELQFPPSMPDEDLVNALAQYLSFDPVERQALLERHGPVERCRSLVELLEMKLLASNQGWRQAGRH